jgi:hypothetical protein
MKKKTHPFKVRKQNNKDGVCTCAVNTIISPHCLEIGICPSLKICAVFEGYRIGVATDRASLNEEKEININFALNLKPNE